jgi:peptidoglycan/xylan/chitin deacetylase (PgdA/CDA1 family)
MPGKTNPLVTMSWDDGHPLDLRLADLLAKYGFKATLYVPGRFPSDAGCQANGARVLSGPELRQLARHFEIGSHTLDHSRLDSVSIDEANRQIVEGKRWLEGELGCSVPGFCYPGGSYTTAVRQLVRDAGFSYARTTDDLYCSASFDRFLMPVSFHFYPRDRKYVLRNFVKNPNRGLRAAMFSAAMLGNGLLSGLESGLDYVCRRGGIFHLWGHSWELGTFGGWPLLESFLRYAADRAPQASRVTNGEVVEAFARTP